jgi:lipid II:glycine glycyltransferase (peptidoglycan interpeptide bridge formation enzyme)
MAYIPFGPLAAENRDLDALWPAIRARVRARRAAFVRIEPGIYHPVYAPPADAPDWSRWGFRPSPQTIQPPNTILIDLSGDEAAILARMNQGTRRKIRAGAKGGARVHEATAADLPKFTALMAATGARNAFGVHDPAYYERAYALFAPQNAALILAELAGETLAGVMVFAVGATAWYLYGASASSEAARGLSAGYGAQWAAIQWARARGCTVYDLWGIPDADAATLEAEFQTRSDGLWHVYGMKRGWGGEVVRSVGAWDLILNPLVYAAVQLALRARREAGGD